MLLSCSSPLSYPAVNRYSSSSMSSQASNDVSNITGQSESSDEVFNMQVCVLQDVCSFIRDKIPKLLLTFISQHLLTGDAENKSDKMVPVFNGSTALMDLKTVQAYRPVLFVRRRKKKKSRAI